MTRETPGAMTEWSPDTYLAFADHRLRPALELLARVPRTQAATVVDLGCGTGTVTPYLSTRWPEAAITGVDSSPAMLGRARESQPEHTWIEADAATWRADTPIDVLYSNAALHWVGDHERLFPALVDQLSPDGTLAVQMPHNFAEPTHTTITNVARSGEWSVDLEPHLWGSPVAEPSWYLDLLAPRASVEVWATTYYEELTGPDPVTTWVSGTALRPILSALPAEEAAAFRDRYARSVAGHYPTRPDGVTVLPFTRLFLVATRRP